MAGWFYWLPLEVGVRYRSRAACLCMRGAFDVLFWMNFIVFPFVNIALMDSIDANCESQIMAGTSLNAAVKNCIACVFDFSFSLLILLLVMIAPYGLLKSQLNLGNIFLHCCKLVLDMIQSYHF